MHTAKSLKNKSYLHIYIYIHKNKIRKYVLARILVLITSLLKSREPGQYFKNSQKNYFFLLISRVIILYVRCIPSIKILWLMLEQLGFTR